MKVLIGLVVLILIAVALWPREGGLLAFSPGPQVRIKWHRQDPVSYGADGPVNASNRMQDLVRVLENQIRAGNRTTIPVIALPLDANTTTEGNELTFVDQSFVMDAAHITPNDYSRVRPLAILAVDPYVLSIPSELPYRSLATVLDVTGNANDGADFGQGIHIVPSNITGYITWIWARPAIEALLQSRNRRVSYHDADIKDDVDVRRMRLRAAIEGQAPALIVATLSQVSSVLGDRPHELHPLIICDEQPAEINHITIPTARNARFDCPLTPFIAVVINKSVTSRAEKYWRKKLTALSESSEWRAALDEQGLLPRFLVGDDAQRFLDQQLKVAASFYKKGR